MIDSKQPGGEERPPPPFELRTLVTTLIPEVDADLAVLHLTLLQIGRMVEVPARTLVSRDGLDTSDAVALVGLLLAGRGANLNATQLAGIVVQTRSGMAKTVRRLNAAGLLTQDPDPDDLRAKLLALTPQGENLAKRYMRELTQVWEERLRLGPGEISGHADSAWRLLRLVDPTFDPGPAPDRD